MAVSDELVEVATSLTVEGPVARTRLVVSVTSVEVAELLVVPSAADEVDVAASLRVVVLLVSSVPVGNVGPVAWRRLLVS